MTIAFMASGEQGDLLMWNSMSSSNVSISTTIAPPVGTKTFRFSGVTVYAYRNVSASSTYYAKFRVYTNSNLLINFREDTTLHISVGLQPATGLIIGYRNTTELGRASAGFALNTWHVIEVYGLIADGTGGAVTVRIDGVDVLTLTGKDTRNSGSAGTCNNIGIVGENGTAYFTDVVFRDDTWEGCGAINVGVPIGVGSLANWNASAGNPYECVDEVPVVFTDYLSAAAGTPNTKHDLAMSDLPDLVYASIPAVGIAALAKLDGAGSGNMRVYADSGGSVSNGASKALSTTEQWLYNFMAVDPQGSGAWTEARVNALLAGVETL
jgi:hypothetical protein